MTIDEAIAKIPDGWRLRLTNYEELDPDTKATTGSGWGAELHHRILPPAVGDADTPVAAILEAIAARLA